MKVVKIFNEKAEFWGSIYLRKSIKRKAKIKCLFYLLKDERYRKSELVLNKK